MRAQRKRSALSQDEVAFLLGTKAGSKISRYENTCREPELRTALGFEVIFDCPVAELFPDLFKQIEAAVRKRAKQLAKRAIVASSRALLQRKEETIKGVINKKKNK